MGAAIKCIVFRCDDRVSSFPFQYTVNIIVDFMANEAMLVDMQIYDILSCTFIRK